MNEPIGYQVIDKAGKLPEDHYPFEVFSLKYCLNVIQEEKGRWFLLPIWRGDLQNPTIYK
jgi:hypothetical protein